MPQSFPNSRAPHSPAAPSDLAAEKLRRSEAYLTEAQRLSHIGSLGWSHARTRPRNLGGQLRIWSRPGAGTEVEISVAGSVAQAAHTPV